MPATKKKLKDSEKAVRDALGRPRPPAPIAPEIRRPEVVRQHSPAPGTAMMEAPSGFTGTVTGQDIRAQTPHYTEIVRQLQEGFRGATPMAPQYGQIRQDIPRKAEAPAPAAPAGAAPGTVMAAGAMQGATLAPQSPEQVQEMTIAEQVRQVGAELTRLKAIEGIRQKNRLAMVEAESAVRTKEAEAKHVREAPGRLAGALGKGLTAMRHWIGTLSLVGSRRGGEERGKANLKLAQDKAKETTASVKTAGLRDELKGAETKLAGERKRAQTLSDEANKAWAMVEELTGKAGRPIKVAPGTASYAYWRKRAEYLDKEQQKIQGDVEAGHKGGTLGPVLETVNRLRGRLANKIETKPKPRAAKTKGLPQPETPQDVIAEAKRLLEASYGPLGQSSPQDVYEMVRDRIGQLREDEQAEVREWFKLRMSQ